jgi:hypothetical protein
MRRDALHCMILTRPSSCRSLVSQHGHLIIVKYLLEVLTVRVDMVDYDGWSALMFAASKGHWHIVEYLVQARDADVLECTVQKDTPLMLAANNGYLNVVRYLVEHTDAGDKFDDESLKAKAAKLQALEDEANGVDHEHEEDDEHKERDPDPDDEDEDDEEHGREDTRKKASEPPTEMTVEQLAEQAKAEQALQHHAASMLSMDRRGLEQAVSQLEDRMHIVSSRRVWSSHARVLFVSCCFFRI